MAEARKVQVVGPAGVRLHAGRRRRALSGVVVLASMQAAGSMSSAPAAPVLSLAGPGSGVVGAAATFTLSWSGITSPGAATLAWPGSEVFNPATVAVGVGSGSAQFTLTPSDAGSGNVVATLDALSSNGVPFSASPAAPAAPQALADINRTNRALLFQPADSQSRPEQVDGGGAYEPDTHTPSGMFGPTRAYVGFADAWAWLNDHGDYVDATLTPQGTTPWASQSVPSNATGGATQALALDVSAALRYVQVNGKHAAFKLHTQVARSVHTAWHASAGTRPRIDVTYADGSTATLPCTVVAEDKWSGASITPNTTAATMPLPCFIEFVRPTKIVATATMHLTISNLAPSGTALVEVRGVLTPPLNAQPITGVDGVVAAGGDLDAGLGSHPNVIAMHRYMDGGSYSTWVYDNNTLDLAEDDFSPHFWGGAINTSKLPYTSQAPTATALVKGPRWAKLAQEGGLGNLEFMTSAQLAAAGVTPLAPGMGALVSVMPAQSVSPGQQVGNTGTSALKAYLLLPEPIFGQAAPHQFWRYYIWLDRSPATLTPTDRPQVLSSSNIVWTNHTGKGMMGPAHAKGNSQSSGGGNGWQLRMSWYDCDFNVGGPIELGSLVGYHLFDYKSFQPPGHRYGDNPQFERWGQFGGYGSVIYHGNWYCIEGEQKLNTVDFGAGTHQADGELRAWVNGRLVYERTGLVFRTPPINTAPANFRPMRELTATHYWWDFFHGGQTVNTKQRRQVITGVMVATSRIGPMKIPAPAPSWQPGPGQAVQIGYSSGAHPQGAAATMHDARTAVQAWNPEAPGDGPWSRNGSGATTWPSITDYSAPVFVPSLRMVANAFQAGHAAINVPTPFGLRLQTLDWAWLDYPPPTDGFDACKDSNPPSGMASQAALSAVYAPTLVDAAWGEWQGGDTSFGAYARPGRIYPEGTHTYGFTTWVPGSAAGNTNGILVCPTSGGGALNGSLLPGGGHHFDLDTMRMVRNAGRRLDNTGTAGGACWSSTISRVVVIARDAGSDGHNLVDLFDPAPWARTWVRRTLPSGTRLTSESPALREHAPSGLILVFVPVLASGAISGGAVANSVRHDIWAAPAAAILAGTASFTNLTVSATSWPLGSFAGLTATCSAKGWSEFVTAGGRNAFYAVNGVDGSNTLWRLKPPAGAVTQADHLSGTWTVTTETVAGSIVMHDKTGAANQQYLYQGPFWDAVSDSLIVVSNGPLDRATSVQPALA